MKPDSPFTYSDHSMISRSYADLKQSISSRLTGPQEVALVDKAFEWACAVHEGQRRRGGDPAVLHPIGVAKIVSQQIGLGLKSVCAALLHDSIESGKYTREDIEREFSPKIASLVDGVNRMREILTYEDISYESRTLQVQHLKKMLLTMNGDTRTILIKLADRLHNCRTIEYLPAYKREKILTESEFLFIPLASRLGLGSIKSEMENIWLQYRHPKEYSEISRLINRGMKDKEKVIDEFLAPLCEALDKAGVKYKIKRRVKSPYSIWNKITAKGVSFDQISDLLAVRVVFTPSQNTLQAEKDECFRIFGIITGVYQYIPSRVRDWITHPKSSGYEALHLTVTGPENTSVEVQIRSQRMDETAEKGIAAHWKYKKEFKDFVPRENQMENFLTSVKDILEDGGDDLASLLDTMSDGLQNGPMTIFDKDGKAHDMPGGATALDFASLAGPYEKEHAVAAKINYVLSPLEQRLASGDRVEIITTRKVYPRQK